MTGTDLVPVNGHSVPVTLMPFIDPARSRSMKLVAPGMTVEQIVAFLAPELSTEQLRRVRVWLVSPKGISERVYRNNWHLTKPHAGIHVVVRVVPADGSTGRILQAVVSVAAIAAATFFAGPAGLALAGATGLSVGTATTLASVAISTTVLLVGGLLIQALVPPPNRNDQEKKSTYSITGWNNSADPNGVIPTGLGKIRRAPNFAAMPYREIVGDDVFLRSLFLVDYGRTSISEIRIGDTSIDDFLDVEYEIREGLDSDDPVTLYPSQVIEQQMNAELDRPYPKLANGDPNTDGTPIDQPVVRVTAADTKTASIIISFPYGLGYVNSKSGNSAALTASFTIRQRELGETTWDDVTTLTFSEAKPGIAFFRQHTWDFSSRGRYEIEVNRQTPEYTDTNGNANAFWAALQSIRPEYPINFGAPLALIATRIRATSQLQGNLDSLNCIGERYCLDWDSVGEEWVEQETRNPASLFRYVLQGEPNAEPVADDDIDLEALQEWHEFCDDKGLYFDRMFDSEGSLQQALMIVAAAGRASPRHDGIQWGVIIDRPQSIVIDEINSRNAWNFQWSQDYVKTPDAYRISFFDETNDWKPTERLVPWHDHVGSIDTTEEIQIPGKTSPDEIWIEARRRMYELEARLTNYTATMDGAARIAVRGDLVHASFYEISSRQYSARVKSVDGNAIEIDELITLEADFACEFRVYANDDDYLGTSTVRTILDDPRETNLFVVTGSGSLPVEGDLIHIGPAAAVSKALIISKVEAGEDMTSVLHMLPAAPEIDTLTDAETPPAWDGRVGEIYDLDEIVPDTPEFTGVNTGSDALGQNPAHIYVSLKPGSVKPVGYYEVDHKLSSSGIWTTETVSVSDASLVIDDYSEGDEVDVRARALSEDDSPSSYTSTVTLNAGPEYNYLMESGDVLLLESGDRYVLE